MLVTVEVDIDDILEDLSDTQYRNLIQDGVRDGFGPEGYHKAEACESWNLDDPARRLELIVELRKRGYTVESA